MKARLSMLMAVMAVAAAGATTGTLAFSQEVRQSTPGRIAGKLAKEGFVQAPAAEAGAKRRVYAFEWGAFDQDQKLGIIIAATGGGQFKGFNLKLENERWYQDPANPEWRGWVYDVKIEGKDRKFLMGAVRFAPYGTYLIAEYDEGDNLLFTTFQAKRADK
jgi:hypothetical protein